MNNFKVQCSSEEGQVFLRLKQGEEQKILDISNYNDYVDLSSFKEGYMNVHTYNEEAKNVKLKVTWKLNEMK